MRPPDCIKARHHRTQALKSGLVIFLCQAIFSLDSIIIACYLYYRGDRPQKFGVGIRPPIFQSGAGPFTLVYSVEPVKPEIEKIVNYFVHPFHGSFSHKPSSPVRAGDISQPITKGKTRVLTNAVKSSMFIGFLNSARYGYKRISEFFLRPILASLNYL